MLSSTTEGENNEDENIFRQNIEYFAPAEWSQQLMKCSVNG